MIWVQETQAAMRPLLELCYHGTITSMRRGARWAGWNNGDDVCTEGWMGG